MYVHTCKNYKSVYLIQNGINDSFKEDETEGKRNENINFVSFLKKKIIALLKFLN